jgi:hypothetical protein
MAEELGKIDRPEARRFEGKTKIYLVPLIFQGKDAPVEYVDKFNLYWEQAKEHVIKLETKIGWASRIYHESITVAGEDGLKVMEKLSPESYQITIEKCHNGAQLEAVEDEELLKEAMDWERCLLLGFMSEKVARKVSEFYLEASRNRYQHIAHRIEETIKPGEAGILFIREGHMIQFPEDIEVFSVAPPVLDEIHRWLRDRSLAAEDEEHQE